MLCDSQASLFSSLAAGSMPFGILPTDGCTWDKQVGELTFVAWPNAAVSMYGLRLIFCGLVMEDAYGSPKASTDG